MSEELKACPFCGSSPHLLTPIPDINVEGYRVSCVSNQCGATTRTCSTEAIATHTWNRRADD